MNCISKGSNQRINTKNTTNNNVKVVSKAASHRMKRESAQRKGKGNIKTYRQIDVNGEDGKRGHSSKPINVNVNGKRKSKGKRNVKRMMSPY